MDNLFISQKTAFFNHILTWQANGTGKQRRAKGTGKRQGQMAQANGMGKWHRRTAWEKTRLHTVYTLFTHCIHKTVMDDGRMAQRAKNGLQIGCTKKNKEKRAKGPLSWAEGPQEAPCNG